VHKFFSYGASVLALRWPAADGVPPSFFYSLIAHVPDTMEIIEIISATAPSDPRLVVQEFPMARHVFIESDLVALTNSTGATPLHISRSHYDLDAVKDHYERFFQMKPVHEAQDVATGVSFVSFWHQSPIASPGVDVDTIRTQVMYWNRPDQSMTVAHTTEWLERRLEQFTSQYLRTFTCWPVWGDNHYTLEKVPGEYFTSVKNAYDDAGIGYMIFRDPAFGPYVFTGYFPMPGGMYIELMPPVGTVYAPADVPTWDSDAQYCYTFTCPP
jgi:hypothetical protein